MNNDQQFNYVYVSTPFHISLLKIALIILGVNRCLLSSLGGSGSCYVY